MTPEQREQLKQAAQAATPGPWVFSKYGSVMDAEKANVIVSSESEFNDKLYITAADPAAILSLIAQVEALTVPQGSIGSQEFLKWNRSQPIPLVAIPMEMGVYRKAIEIHKALSNSSEIEGIAARTIPAIPGTKEGA